MSNELKPWGQAEKDLWFQGQSIKRSYENEVLIRIHKLRHTLDINEYGVISYGPLNYPVYVLKTRSFSQAKKTILITGGVHGYETSGVHGALEFLESEVQKYEEKFNFICAPCISPWGYETINRWNPLALDPNRSFYAESPVAECRLFLRAVEGIEIFAHFDLHETTDTDNSVFRPALQARDGRVQELTEIPDGFYTVGDTENPKPEFQQAIIKSVKKVTHIAPADPEGRIIGERLQQEGVINYPLKKLNLCAAFSNAPYTTTTEVYPDSPKATPAICIQAQVAAIKGGLDYLSHA